jgi:hypothetical protein
MHKIIQVASRWQVNEFPGAYKEYVTEANDHSQRRGSLKDEEQKASVFLSTAKSFQGL